MVSLDVSNFTVLSYSCAINKLKWGILVVLLFLTSTHLVHVPGISHDGQPSVVNLVAFLLRLELCLHDGPCAGQGVVDISNPLGVIFHWTIICESSNYYEKLPSAMACMLFSM